MKTRTRYGSLAALGACAALALAGCGANTASQTPTQESTTISAEASESPQASEAAAHTAPVKEDITINETLTNDASGEHVIEADATEASYSNVAVVKSGDSTLNDEADFYGDNSAIFATGGGTLDLSNITAETNGKHANAVFSYGEGTTLNVADSVIETTNDTSGGLMTTGGATLNASNLRVTTEGNSSAAIRSDRGGGTVNVDGGIYTTHGTGSPAIYSTADITVSNALLESTASQGVVVEGKNSATLRNTDLVADNNTHNSDKSTHYQAVMIYQSMSGDADSGEASFSAEGGSITNANGDVFFVNNTVATVTLDGVEITNNGDGAFLRAEAAGWGSEGSNGGQVDLKATNQKIQGDVVVDDVSNLNMYLGKGASFEGAVNSAGEAGKVYVELKDGATWTLTADSYISSLTASADSIDLNGHTLYVGTTPYEAGTETTGSAIEHTVSESSGGPGGAPGDMPGGGSGDGDSGKAGQPPAKPDGKGGPGGSGGQPPAKPGSN